MERNHSGESIYKSPIPPTPQVAYELLSVLGLTSAKTNSNQFTENPRPTGRGGTTLVVGEGML